MKTFARIGLTALAGTLAFTITASLCLPLSVIAGAVGLFIGLNISFNLIK